MQKFILKFLRWCWYGCYINEWIFLLQGFIQALLSTAVFPQRFSFFTVCLVNYLREVLLWLIQRENFWSLGLQIAGNCISDTLSDCRSIACTLFVCSGSKFSWNSRVSWGVLWVVVCKIILHNWNIWKL